MYDCIIKNGCVFVDNKNFVIRDIAIKDGLIYDIGNIVADKVTQAIDASGLHILPGFIDTHVHFREPGLEQKEDLEIGSKAALLGGITGVFDMPNTKPATITIDALEDKIRRSKDRMYCDFAFWGGVDYRTYNNLEEMEQHEGCCGIKIFMGSSTGSLGSLLANEDVFLEQVLQKAHKIVAIHAEDENRLQERKHLVVEGDPASHLIWRDAKTALLATQKIVSIAQKVGARVHILHVSTKQEIIFLSEHKKTTKSISCEITPQHLTLFAPDCYQELGTLAQVNPPIRNKEHQDALWTYGINGNIKGGAADTIGSDHAPHTLAEKSNMYPKTPSGMPGVQTFIPVMLNHVHHKRLSLEKLVNLASYNPARLFRIKGRGVIKKGYEATFTIVDLKRSASIQEEEMASKCRWTPFSGYKVTGWPVGVILRGHRVMWEDEIIGAQPLGKPMNFLSSNPK